MDDDGYDPTDPTSEPQNMTGNLSPKEQATISGGPPPTGGLELLYSRQGPVAQEHSIESIPTPMIDKYLGLGTNPDVTREQPLPIGSDAQNYISHILDSMTPEQHAGLRTVNTGMLTRRLVPPEGDPNDGRDWSQVRKNGASLIDPILGPRYMGQLTPLAVQAGAADLDKYNQQFHMPDDRRDAKLQLDMMDVDKAMRVAMFPDYIQRNMKRDLAQKMVDEYIQNGKNKTGL